MTAKAGPSGKPGRDCPRCARLVAFREAWRKREPDWFNAPVPSFGAADARLLIVGLAPGLRGANRTGRPFTGDYAGDLLYATAKSLGFDIDYKRLLREFQSRGYLVRAFYYTAVIEDQEYSSIRPLIDWLDYNGYTVVTKATKEFVDQTGRRKVKGNMDIELAVDAMEIAPHIDQMVLFSGDGDFRSLVEAVQRRGVRVIVVSTISTQPPMVADELRRQADQFVDIVELQNKIGRDPAERPAREPRDAREAREPRHTPQFLQRSTGTQRTEVEIEDEFEED